MDANFWNTRWQEDHTPWHQAEPETLLVKHFIKKEKKCVLVPLCGKSLDLMWLAQNADQVIGVELNPKACKSFFEEQKLPYTENSVEGFHLFKSDNIELWCGDFFNLPAQAYQNVDFIYDRAALIALPSKLRETYIKKIIEILDNSKTNETEILLIGRVDESSNEGPPFPVGEQDVQDFFSEKLNILILEKRSRPSRDNPELKLMETAYRMKKKS